MGSCKHQPSPTTPLCKSQLTELIWAQSGAMLGLIYSDRIKAGSLQHHARAFHSCSSTDRIGMRRVDLLWQLDSPFGEDLCSPKHHPTTCCTALQCCNLSALLHVQFVLLSCVQPGWGCRRGGQCFSWAEPSPVPGAGSQGTFLNKPAQPCSSLLTHPCAQDSSGTSQGTGTDSTSLLLCL